MSTPTTAFASMRMTLDQATKGSDLVRYFRLFLNDADSVQASADTHILTLETELDPVQSNGGVKPTSPPKGHWDTVFANYFESANFGTGARHALLCSVESSVANQLADGVSNDQISNCKIKAVISGKFAFQDFIVSPSVESRSKHDWEPLWRNLMERKLAASRDIARSLERSFASIDVGDDCVHHLEPVRLFKDHEQGFALRMDDYIEYRCEHAQAVTVRCRQPIRGRLSFLETFSEKMDAELRKRALSESWSQDVASQLQGVVDEDEGAESGSDTALDPEDDESHDLALARGRIRMTLGKLDVEM